MKAKPNGKRHAPPSGIEVEAPASAPGRRASRTAVMAGGVALGAGALATSIALMREPIGRLARSAAAEAAALGQHVTPSQLLAIAGLQRRRSVLWTITPMVGMLVAGVAAGSAFAFWLTRGKSRKSTVTNAPSDAPVETGNSVTNTLHAS